jgi:epoxyqueuosine reductase QueG
MNIKEEIITFIENAVLESKSKELFRKPIVGFSSANNPLYEELKEIVGAEHLHPKDILPNAKTVVSFFVPFSESVVKSNRKGQSVSREWGISYVETNSLINRISVNLVDYLDSKNIISATIKATHNYDEKTLKSAWSHRSAAVIANMGKFGLNRMVITSEGCAGRFGTVIISEEVPINNEEAMEYCIYNKNEGCLKCIKSCPQNALNINGFDRFKCNEQLLKNAEELSDIGLCDVCGKCVVSCPFAIMQK